MQNNFLPIILLSKQGHKKLRYPNDDRCNTMPLGYSMDKCKITSEYRSSTTRNRIKYGNLIQQNQPLEIRKQQNLAKFKAKFNDLNDKIDSFFIRHRRERSKSINY